MRGIPLLALGLVACGPCPKDTCTVDLGSFSVAEPKGYDGGPAVIYIHGFGGSAEESLEDESIVAAFEAAGVLVAAPSMDDRTWSIEGTTFGSRDEMAFHDQIRDELSDRFGAEQFFVTAFSLGASVAWDLSCLRSADYESVYTMSGHFWLPLPTCDGPVLPHTHRHGTSDSTFPIEGAEYSGNQQAHLDDAWDVLVERGACTQLDDADGCEVWSCDDGVPLTQCRGDYGHRRPDGWASDAVRRFGL